MPVRVRRIKAKKSKQARIFVNSKNIPERLSKAVHGKKLESDPNTDAAYINLCGTEAANDGAVTSHRDFLARTRVSPWLIEYLMIGGGKIICLKSYADYDAVTQRLRRFEKSGFIGLVDYLKCHEGLAEIRDLNEKGHIHVFTDSVERHLANPKLNVMFYQKVKTPVFEEEVHTYVLTFEPDSMIVAYGKRQNLLRLGGGKPLETYKKLQAECDVCGASGNPTQICEGCNLVRFCGEFHKLAAYRLHQKDCKDYAELKSYFDDFIVYGITYNNRIESITT